MYSFSLDQSLVSIYLLSILFLGFYKKSEKNTKNFLFAGRTLSLPSLVATIVCTWYGGILEVGRFTYQNGIATWIIFGLFYYIAALLFAKYIVPKIIQSNISSIPKLFNACYGRLPAIIATFIYAVPPLVRLTDLGIRLVDKEVIEAADAFGSSKKQKLLGVQLPLALPNIMQGINQCTMMALAMVVIASMIGTRGLGDEVLLGLQQLNVGRAAEAGIAIVLLAIVLDRITQSYGETLQERTTPAKKEKK